MPKFIAWDVFKPDHTGEATLIDTVFYGGDCDGQWVRDGLVDHDGYPHNIIVVKAD